MEGWMRVLTHDGKPLHFIVKILQTNGHAGKKGMMNWNRLLNGLRKVYLYFFNQEKQVNHVFFRKIKFQMFTPILFYLKYGFNSIIFLETSLAAVNLIADVKLKL